MKILPTTSLNDAIRRVASGDVGAASVIAMLNRERPQNIMAYLRSLDERGIYGHAIADMFWKDCAGNFNSFVNKLSLK
jgi:hypothetical protein